MNGKIQGNEGCHSGTEEKYPKTDATISPFYRKTGTPTHNSTNVVVFGIGELFNYRIPAYNVLYEIAYKSCDDQDKKGCKCGNGKLTIIG